MLIIEPPRRIKQSQPKKLLSNKFLHIDPWSDDTLFLFIDMSQLGHVLALFIILASFSSSSGSYQHQDPLYPPASKRAVHNKLKFETQSFGLTTRPIPFTSPKLVNVDDFRAKGDHEADDTEVPTQFFFFFFFFFFFWKNLFFFFFFFFKVFFLSIFFFRTFCLQSFSKAWREACDSKNSVLVVPRNRTYLLKPITFSGPCKSNFTLKVSLRSIYSCMYI
jgi:hypothetical protein